MLALARKIVSGEEEDAATVESVFVEEQQVAAEAEALLVDDGWKLVNVEPEAVAVHANGNESNGHGSNGIGQSVERTLFSWAEFMAEQPEQPRRRGRKAEAASPSLFEWALEREQEGELVGAGR